MSSSRLRALARCRRRPDVFLDPATTAPALDVAGRSEDLVVDPAGDQARRASATTHVLRARGVADLAAGFGAKPGFGHDCSNAFVSAWAAVLPPERRTSADTVRLEQFLGIDNTAAAT